MFSKKVHLQNWLLYTNLPGGIGQKSQQTIVRSFVRTLTKMFNPKFSINQIKYTLCKLIYLKKVKKYILLEIRKCKINNLELGKYLVFTGDRVVCYQWARFIVWPPWRLTANPEGIHAMWCVCVCVSLFCFSKPERFSVGKTRVNVKHTEF